MSPTRRHTQDECATPPPKPPTSTPPEATTTSCPAAATPGLVPRHQHRHPHVAASGPAGEGPTPTPPADTPWSWRAGPGPTPTLAGMPPTSRAGFTVPRPHAASGYPDREADLDGRPRPRPPQPDSALPALYSATVRALSASGPTGRDIRQTGLDRGRGPTPARRPAPGRSKLASTVAEDQLAAPARSSCSAMVTTTPSRTRPPPGPAHRRWRAVVSWVLSPAPTLPDDAPTQAARSTSRWANCSMASRTTRARSPASARAL